MGYIEIISLDDDGVTIKNFDELTTDEKIEIDVEVSLQSAGLAKRTGLLCFTCLVPIPSGMGHSFCEQHKPKTL